MIGRATVRSAVATLTGNDRQVLMTYPGLRLGNFLYFYLQSHLRMQGGHHFRVLRHDRSVEHRALVRSAPEFDLDPSSLRFSDRRTFIPLHFFQRFGVDFSESQLTDFIRSEMLPSENIQSARSTTTVRSDLTVNVRRGDYYTNPEFERLYGMDVVGFVREAVREADGERPVADLRTITLVSDDVEWCRAQLSWLADSNTVLRFIGPRDGVLASFSTVASAERVVLANSTFSYWAAYVGASLHGPNHRAWAPDLHSRSVDDGRPWQHAPHWRRIPVDAPPA